MARETVLRYTCDGCGAEMARPERTVRLFVEGVADAVEDDLCNICGPEVEKTIVTVKKRNGKSSSRPAPRKPAVAGQNGAPVPASPTNPATPAPTTGTTT